MDDLREKIAELLQGYWMSSGMADDATDQILALPLEVKEKCPSELCKDFSTCSGPCNDAVQHGGTVTRTVTLGEAVEGWLKMREALEKK